MMDSWSMSVLLHMFCILGFYTSHGLFGVFARTYMHPNQLPSQLQFDFIIIGAGTAGSVLARRLTESHEVQVLLLEAGISNEGIVDIEVPFFAPIATPNQPWTWNFMVAPQTGLDNRTFPYPRGRVLGGSSSVNFMVYTRGSRDDFDRYANVTNDPGWSWDSLIPITQKYEDFRLPAGINNTGRFLPDVHTSNGLLPITLSSNPVPIADMVLNATQELSQEFFFNLDMNSGDTLGIGWAQYTVKNGTRASSATAYLEPNAIERPNLHVLLNTTATKLISSGHDGHARRFDTVEFAQSAAGKRTTVRAAKEVLLSAGAISSPQLLMLSGIGNKAELASLGLQTLVSLPEVGKNLQDHPFLPNNFLVNSTVTLDEFERNDTLVGEALEQWNASRTGPLIDGPGPLLGWFRLPPNASIFENNTDPTAGPTSAHFEMIISNQFTGIIERIPATGNFLALITTVASPASRGTVTLNTTNPFAPPVIDPKFLDDPVDQFVMREAMRAVRRFVSAPSFQNYVLSPFQIAANATSDEDFDAFARNFTTTEWHPVGTASMSARNASNGVVDPDLCVKHTSGLRIVDASILPFIPAAHPQAAVYVVAERAAELIKQRWHL